MNDKKEIAMTIKLDPKVHRQLERRADENGRATMREAEVLIKEGLKR